MKLQKTQRVVFAILILVGTIFLCQDNATAGALASAAKKALEKAVPTQTQIGASNSVSGAIGAAARTALRTGASQNTHSNSVSGAIGAAAERRTTNTPVSQQRTINCTVADRRIATAPGMMVPRPEKPGLERPSFTPGMMEPLENPRLGTGPGIPGGMEPFENPQIPPVPNITRPRPEKPGLERPSFTPGMMEPLENPRLGK